MLKTRVCMVAVAAFIGCKASETASSTAGTLPCKSVAEHLAAVVIAQTAKPGIQFLGPEAGPVILRVVAARCDQDRWSEEAKGCYLAMQDTNGWQACEAKLTEEQVTKIQAEMSVAKAHGSDAAPAIDSARPWIDRAEKALPALLDGKNGEIVATAILSITHSQGLRPRMKTYEIRRMGERISIVLVVNWEGSVMRDASGNPVVYATEVVWEFSEHGHGSAKVTADNGTFGPGGAQSLDDWFRNKLYPSLYRVADDARGVQR